MSLSKYESDIKHLAVPAAAAIARLGDLRNLEGIRQRLDDPDTTAMLADKVSAGQMEQIRASLESMTFTEDSMTMDSPAGTLALTVVERTDNCVKMAAEGAPIPLYVWIQVVPEGEASKMRVTVGADVNMFMKPLLSKPLSQAAEGLASVLVAALNH